MASSALPGFYRMSREERLDRVIGETSLDAESATIFRDPKAPMTVLEHMIENVIGALAIPVGIATNFCVNGRDVLVPMAIEEPSVVAAASKSAKIARAAGGFTASTSGPVMIAQIQLVGVTAPFHARQVILGDREAILALANEQDPVLVKFGGGARDVEVRVIDADGEPMVVTHLIVDTRDAMGANAVNTMAEAVAPHLEKLTGGRVYLRILSNLAVKRLARSRAVFGAEALGGAEVVDGVISAYRFAAADPFRAATHNKGIMNGISACVLATGNDTRAVEAGAHAYASYHGRYTSLTRYEKLPNGDLAGSIELPLAVGLVGGATATHPAARAAVKILGVKTATELAEIFASVGLAQNLAAMRALATEGIQRGHMALHARNIAITAGATGAAIDEIAQRMVAERRVRVDRAQELLAELG